MKKVAKLVIVDNQNKYLLMTRSGHPTFGKDSDIPGGTLEEGESPLATMLREVQEEAGLSINKDSVEELYTGTKYSRLGTQYSLFITKLNERPSISLSWEHSSYEWLDYNDFLEKSKNAKDIYMHMVYELLK